MEYEDELARLRAQTDQAREAIREVALNLWAFHTALTDAGFNEEQALVLTIEMLSGCLPNWTGEDA
jgi:hypothetical protein